MTSAVVLGGGGPVGVGWEAGLLVGLAGRGVDVARADAVIGTSAGSIVGLTLASGQDLAESIELVGEASGPALADPAVGAAGQGLEQLMASVAEAAGDPGEADAIRARLGRLAVEATTISEDVWLAMFDSFADVAWPEAFACTAVDVEDGGFKVWTGADRVDPRRAVASSCAVPCIFPPVSIGGRRWMDGGVRDMLNADAASGHDKVLAVSCTVLELPAGMSTPAMDALFAATRAQLEGLASAGAQVETVVPAQEMLAVSEWGLSLMDFSRVPAAYEAGLRQGKEEAARLAAFWND